MTDDYLTLTFGRHRGRRVDDGDVPRSYLCWLLELPRVREDTRDAVREELARRGLPFGKWKGVPLNQIPDNGYLEWLSTNAEIRSPLDDLVRLELKRRRQQERELRELAAWQVERKRSKRKKRRRESA
jgi:uncharacterized protein (DUF3820 family)